MEELSHDINYSTEILHSCLDSFIPIHASLYISGLDKNNQMYRLYTNKLMDIQPNIFDKNKEIKKIIYVFCFMNETWQIENNDDIYWAND